MLLGMWGLREINRGNSDMCMTFDRIYLNSLGKIRDLAQFEDNKYWKYCGKYLPLTSYVGQSSLFHSWENLGLIVEKHPIHRSIYVLYMRIFKARISWKWGSFSVIGSFYSKCICSCHTIVIFNRWLARIIRGHDKSDIPSSKISWKDKEIRCSHKFIHSFNAKLHGCTFWPLTI